jgi:hypothetical protein
MDKEVSEMMKGLCVEVKIEKVKNLETGRKIWRLVILRNEERRLIIKNKSKLREKV